MKIFSQKLSTSIFGKHCNYTPIAIIAVGLLSGCAVGPKQDSPEISTPGYFKNDSINPLTTGYSIPNPLWWKEFGDPILDSFVDRAMDNSPDMDAAFARVERASALAGISKSSLFPSVDFTGSALRQRTSGNTGSKTILSNKFSNALGLAWEVDLWGRVRHLKNSAETSAEAEARSYDYAVLTLRAKVVEAYFNIRVLDKTIEILKQTANYRESTLKLVQLRKSSGLGDELELAQSNTELFATLADLSARKRERALAENALAILVGAFSSEFSLTADATWDFPAVKVPQALPSELLRRRPDVLEAELLMRAASSKIGAVYADYFPRVTLTGNLGFAASDINKLYARDSLFGSMGPSISWNVFNSGLTESIVEQAKADYTELAALYRKQILTAFGQVEDALASLKHLQAETTARAQAATSAQRAAKLARERYQSGIIGNLEVIDTERSALNTAQTSLQSRSTQLMQSIELIRALGGGWLSIEGTNIKDSSTEELP